MNAFQRLKFLCLFCLGLLAAALGRRRRQAEHRRHPGRRPRQRRSWLSRERHQDARTSTGSRRRACGSNPSTACRCAPPPAPALMTGRYPMRYGLQTLVIFPNDTYGLPTDERTLPQALKEAGYQTMMVGKWHLGHADQKFWPQQPRVRVFLRQHGRRGRLLHPSARRRDRLAAQRQVHHREGLRHHAVRRRGRQADREAGQDEAVLPLLRVARSPCALPGAKGRRGPLRLHDQGPDASHLRGDDHVARRPGRENRRRARKNADCARTR